MTRNWLLPIRAENCCRDLQFAGKWPPWLVDHFCWYSPTTIIIPISKTPILRPESIPVSISPLRFIQPSIMIKITCLAPHQCRFGRFHHRQPSFHLRHSIWRRQRKRPPRIQVQLIQVRHLIRFLTAWANCFSRLYGI